MDSMFWQISQLGDAITTLTSQLNWKIGEVQLANIAGEMDSSREKINDRIISLADLVGIKAEPVMVQYSEIENLLKKAPPAIFLIQKEGKPFLLMVLNCNGESLEVLGSDLVRHKLAIHTLRSLFCQSIETPVLAEIDELLTAARIDESQKVKARDILLKERIGDRWIGDCWIVRQSVADSLGRQAHQTGMISKAIVLLLSYLLYYSLWLFSWWLIGRGVLQGHIDPGWLAAWGLALLTLVPLKMAIRWLQGVLSVNIGCLLKEKLFYSALRLNPDSIRYQGIGQLMGYVAESEKLETMGINGGFVGLLAGVEMVLAFYVLAKGFGGVFHIAVLIAWLMVTLLITGSFYRKRKDWTDCRLNMTHNLIESMVGHRTRLAQQPSHQWHEAEDQELNHYGEICSRVDQLAILLTSLVPRGWIVVALISFVPILAFRNPSVTSMAVAIGGILLAYQALKKLTASLNQITGAIIAWDYVKSFFDAATQSESPGVPSLVAIDSTTDSSDNGSLLYLRDLDFSHVGSVKKVLDGCDLKISLGDRLLLQGPSGGGKSTFVSLLTVLRKPAAGFLLLKGLDEKSWGTARWRKQVVAAPQFHENRILSGTFAFNLLMGCQWPPTQHDLDKAEALCRQLGLGKLLDQMPSGMMQMVGETGWQLSHGEKSRVYIARALLQNAPLNILDESFAALDPETLSNVLKTVEQRTKTLLVIAHP